MTDYNYSFEVNKLLYDKDMEIERLKNKLSKSYKQWVDGYGKIQYILIGEQI